MHLLCALTSLRLARLAFQLCLKAALMNLIDYHGVAQSRHTVIAEVSGFLTLSLNITSVSYTTLNDYASLDLRLSAII